MGQGQSAEEGGASSDAPRKTCYYETLGVSMQASDEEIKKAYRRKALELHPDRNYGNSEAATAQFSDVQAAYEVLSDPHERAWYDSHRDTILRGGDASSPDVYDHDVRVTTAEDITRIYMAFDGRPDMTDSPTGFFTSLRALFNKLADEETLASANDGLDPVDYPSFGSSQDTQDSAARRFYAGWAAFATHKSFAWKDMYRLSEAPDRRTRRAMEKENARLRAAGQREFNEAVRALVAFVRRRDPRHTQAAQSEAERQAVLRDAAAQQAARQRKANAQAAQEWVAPEWVAGSADEHEGGFDESSDDQETTVLECVVCGKIFKSESQFGAHEQSKKHKKAVAELERRMRKENKELGLDVRLVEEQKEEDEDEDEVEEADEEAKAQPAEDKTEREELDHAAVPVEDDASHKVRPALSPAESASESDADSDYAPRDAVEARIVGIVEPVDHLSTDLASSALDSPSSETPSAGGPKLGAAKLKKQKKAAAAAAAKTGAAPGEEFRCAKCQSGFPSKTRLFNHIKEAGHAAPVPAGGGGGGKKGKKGRA